VTALVGSASLIGGHGTTIAWAPIITELFGLSNALEVGIATATLGLVIASLVGGPIAGVLIARHHLAGPSAPDPVVGLPDDPSDRPVDDISYIDLLRTLLVLNVRSTQNASANTAAPGRKALEIVPNASHLYPERGALEAVIDHAVRWFERCLKPGSA
jgi:sodium--glutamate symport carrier gltS